MTFFLLSFKKFIFEQFVDVLPVSFYIFELFLVAVNLYVISNLLVVVIELIPIKQLFNFKYIFLILMVSFVLHIIFEMILWPSLVYGLAFILHEDYHKINEPNAIFSKQLVNYFFFLFMTINWLVFIYAYKIYQSNQLAIEQKLTLEKNLKEANLNTLKGQINPHFMFNSLNNIRGLVQEDPLKSKIMITRLSELLRSSLLSGKTNTISLEQELENVENFLEISKIRYEDRLKFFIILLLKPKAYKFHR